MLLLPMIEDMTVRGFSEKTGDYIHNVRSIAALIGWSPATMRVSGRGRTVQPAAREAGLLPVGYFHLVFTLLAEIAPIAGPKRTALIGFRTSTASSTAIRFIITAIVNTACQLPVTVASTLPSGTRREATPFAV
jgi:hypothetical protein